MEPICQGAYQSYSYGERKRNVSMALASVTCQMLDDETIMIGLDGLPVNWKN
jgi:hypothetical protein